MGIKFTSIIDRITFDLFQHFNWSFLLTFPPPCLSLHPFSSPLAWAVLLYLRHSGIKLRDSKVFPGLSTEKEKWLAFLKTKKVRGVSAAQFSQSTGILQLQL